MRKKPEVKQELKEEAKPEIKPEASEPLKKEDMAYTARGEILSELAGRVRADRDAELKNETLEEKPDLEAAAKEAETAAETTNEQETTQETVTVSATQEAEPKKKKYKVLVDGVETEFDEEKIIERGLRALSKEDAADKRLEEANRLLNEARALKEKPQPSESASDVAKPPSNEDVAQLAEALMYGEKDKVIDGLSKLLNTGRQQVATQTQGMNKDQMLAFTREAIAFENAKTRFNDPPEKGGYADIVKDPVLSQVFYVKEHEYINVKKDQRPYWEIYSEIGDGIRKWRDGLIKAANPSEPQKTESQEIEKRVLLKRSAGVATTAGGRAPNSTQEKKPRTREEILEDMRKTRQPSTNQLN